MQFEALREQLGNDGGRRHGHGQPHRQTSAPALAIAKPGNQAGTHCGQCHLGAAVAEYQRAHRLQAWQTELEADGKHQKDDAKFGQGVDLAAFCKDIDAMRSQHDADGQIGKHRRNPKMPHHGYRDDRGTQQDEHG